MSDIVATGIFYHDAKDGSRKWITGDMLMAHIRTLADARAKRQNARLEKFAEALGRKFAEERAANRREIEQLRADVEALRDALMLPKGASAGERRVQ